MLLPAPDGVSKDTADLMVESGEIGSDGVLASLTRCVVWNETELAAKFGLSVRKTHTTNNMCLAFSYLSAMGELSVEADETVCNAPSLSCTPRPIPVSLTQ
jgi:hypothetical protein